MSQFCDICDIFVAGDLSQCDIFDGASWIADFLGACVRKNRFGGLRWTREAGLGKLGCWVFW